MGKYNAAIHTNGETRSKVIRISDMNQFEEDEYQTLLVDALIQSSVSNITSRIIPPTAIDLFEQQQHQQLYNPDSSSFSSPSTSCAAVEQNTVDILRESRLFCDFCDRMHHATHVKTMAEQKKLLHNELFASIQSHDATVIKKIQTL